MSEEWRDIEGYEGVYQVSSMGRVRNTTKKNGKTISVFTRGRGYGGVALRKNNAPVSVYVHRLVAMAFINKPEYANIVNHKNGIKKDNRVENLEWCNHAENSKHAIATGLIRQRGENSSSAKFTLKEVIMIKKFYSLNRISIREVSELLDVSFTCIQQIINNKRYDLTDD